MEASFFERHPRARDVLNFFIFVVCIVVGTVLINTFIFRSFNVDGHSMEKTLHDGDRLIVNRLPITAAQLQNKQYTPDRGQVIVFKNPRFVAGSADEYLVKRVIAFAGERVKIINGTLIVYNDAHPDGYQPDAEYQKNDVGPQSPSSGEGLDTTVPDGTVFVGGDNRIGGNSYDSRTGLGTIPLFDIVGPVAYRIWPLPTITSF